MGPPIDLNDGNCEEPNDCLDEPFCHNHPKCDPKCKGDGCNHPDCKDDPRCPSLPFGKSGEPVQVAPKNLCNPHDPTDRNCDWAPFNNPNSQLCGACNYPQRVNPQCIVPPNNCEHPRARTQAHEECAILKGPGFAPCHEVLHPDPFYHACIQDRCRNFGRKPVCDILNAYALECSRANVKGMRWRSMSNCARTCPSPFIWADCGKPCDETCDDPAPACFGKCVPGCRCPAGLLKHEVDCIPKEQCPSYVKPAEKKYDPFKCTSW